MEKVFLKAYFKKNLGDDLFLHILSNRYKNNFIAICSPKYRYKNCFFNIQFNKSYFEYYFYRILETILKKKNILEKKYISKAKLILTIGGSIFIENKNNTIDLLEKQYSIYKNNIPYFILGANFGPYYTEQYKNYIETILNKAEDVCFRDKYSYNLFSKNENVRYATDIVFSLDTTKIKTKKSKKIIMSIINCESRFSNEITSLYEEKIIELIKFFTKRDYGVTLMSFCKAEGDEIAINRILRKIKKMPYYKLINKYFYKGNISEALNVIADSEMIIGSRFHATILGLLFDKAIMPIVYSNKTTNLLKDLNYKGKIFDIRKIDDIKVNNLKLEDLISRLII